MPGGAAASVGAYGETAAWARGVVLGEEIGTSAT